MDKRKGINVFTVLPKNDELSNREKFNIINSIKRNYIYDVKMREIKDCNGNIYISTNHLSLSEQNKFKQLEKEIIKYKIFNRNIQKIAKCDIIYFAKGWGIDTECKILYQVAKEFDKDILSDDNKRMFIGYMRLSGLQEFEGAGYYKNIGIYYGDNMEELISNYMQYNKITPKYLKCHNEQYFDFGCPILFIPINEVFSVDNVIDILDTTKGVGNPFK